MPLCAPPGEGQKVRRGVQLSEAAVSPQTVGYRCTRDVSQELVVDSQSLYMLVGLEGLNEANGSAGVEALNRQSSYIALLSLATVGTAAHRETSSGGLCKFRVLQ